MVKAAIFYFSQEGHTKSIAERIKKNFEGELFNIISDKIKDISDFEVFFFVTPVYYWQEPWVWKRFFNEMSNVGNKPAFLVTTSGVKTPYKINSWIMGNFSDYSKKKGLRFVSSFNVVCADTYPPFKKIGLNKDRPNNKDLSALDNFIKTIDLKGIKKSSNKRPLQSKYGYFIYLLSPKPRVKKRLCNNCGICKEICPMNNITDGLSFGNNCMKCYLCEKKCPNHAIQPRWLFFDVYAKFKRLFFSRK